MFCATLSREYPSAAAAKDWPQVHSQLVLRAEAGGIVL